MNAVKQKSTSSPKASSPAKSDPESSATRLQRQHTKSNPLLEFQTKASPHNKKSLKKSGPHLESERKLSKSPFSFKQLHSKKLLNKRMSSGSSNSNLSNNLEKSRIIQKDGRKSRTHKKKTVQTTPISPNKLSPTNSNYASGLIRPMRLVVHEPSENSNADGVGDSTYDNYDKKVIFNQN